MDNLTTQDLQVLKILSQNAAQKTSLSIQCFHVKTENDATVLHDMVNACQFYRHLTNKIENIINAQ